MGHRVQHFLGVGHLMRPITELFISGGAVHHCILSAMSAITFLPSSCMVCIKTDFFFFFELKEKLQPILLCSANNYPPGLQWSGRAASLIRICYDPPNYKHAQKTPVLISALSVSEIPKAKQVFN